WPGWARGGGCGGAMFGAGTKESPTFRCRPQPGSPACAVTVAARHVETLVTEAVLLRLDGPGLAKALRAHPSECEDTAAIDLSRAESRLTELAEAWAAGAISRSESLGG